MMPQTYKDGDKVAYKLGDFLTGSGIIRGQSTTPIYGIGAVYIVEDTSGNLPNKTYPYKFFTCAEIHLSLVN